MNKKIFLLFLISISILSYNLNWMQTAIQPEEETFPILFKSYNGDSDNLYFIDSKNCATYQQGIKSWSEQLALDMKLLDTTSDLWKSAVDKVVELLAQGANPNAKGNEENTPLIYAAKKTT